MADGLKKAAIWLGLVSDNNDLDQRGNDDLTEEVVRSDPRREEPHSATVTELETRRPVQPVVRPADLSRIITVHPRTYNEARTIGEHFRDGVPVIMNLSDMEDADAKRLVDFAAGLAFALRGSFDKVATKVFLLSPADVDVSAEQRRRIAEAGFYAYQ